MQQWRPLPERKLRVPPPVASQGSFMIPNNSKPYIQTRKRALIWFGSAIGSGFAQERRGQGKYLSMELGKSIRSRKKDGKS